MKVLLFGTHPYQYNGYSKVVHNLANGLASRPDVTVKVFGFQCLATPNPDRVETLHKDVQLYDAAANEEPKDKGFGIRQVRAVVDEFMPDVCVVYNDMAIIALTVSEIRKAQHPSRVVAYVDQVYLHQKRMFIDFLNANVDQVVAFTPFWEETIRKQGITRPTTFLRHGFDAQACFPVPRRLARAYFNLAPDDFVILNMNRNQPRKRWDICLKAFAELVYRYPKEPIKMMIATAVQGAWNLFEIFERELDKRGVSIQDGLKHLIVIDQPQRLSDREINILYNAADVGINTCDGEGFGLCNFEQAGVGVPQVVSRVGGLKDFLDDDCAMLCDPKMAYYVDNSRDSVCGEAELCDFDDFVAGIETYYHNAKLREDHGARARARILRDYDWKDVVDRLVEIVTPPPPPEQAAPESPVFGLTEDPAVPTKKSKKKAAGRGKSAALRREVAELRRVVESLTAARTSP